MLQICSSWVYLAYREESQEVVGKWAGIPGIPKGSKEVVEAWIKWSFLFFVKRLVTQTGFAQEISGTISGGDTQVSF